MKIFRMILIVSFGLILLVSFMGWFLLGPAGDEQVIFEVPEDEIFLDLPQRLEKQGLVKSAFGYRWLASRLKKGLDLGPGGYTVEGSLWAWEVADQLSQGPTHLWFTSYGCVRREQVGEELALVLGWSESQLIEWEAMGRLASSYQEGFYFPDTYLIDRDLSVGEVAQMFLDRFEERAQPLYDQLRRADYSLVETVTIASLIQRETNNENQMPLISGVIHNRLAAEMRLQIDATMQYTLGQREDGRWWGAVDLGQKYSRSPYNTYLYEGLPPTPICSPGLPAIKAALEPAEVDWLYYLHDSSGQMHGAATYAEHKDNIERWL